MSLATYDDLKTAVADWLDREDLTDRVPDFIAMGEAKISRRLRVAEMELTGSATMVNGAVTLPPDFIEARRIISDAAGATGTPLEGITPSYASERFASSQAGVPTHYAIVGDTLVTYPNGGAGDVTMIYYARPPAIAAYGTNWLLTRAPDLYLYASLINAAPFLGDDGRIATWAGLFEQILGELQASDERSRYANARTRAWPGLP